MEHSKHSNKPSLTSVPSTPTKPKQFFKFYVRRKSTKSLNKSQEPSKDPTKEELVKDKCFLPQGDSQHVFGREKKNNSKETKKRKRFHRPRIMEEGKKPRNAATIRLRTISEKRKKKDDTNEDDVIVEPRTPQKPSFPNRRKNEKTKKNVTRGINFNDKTLISCLESNRITGPNFPKGRKRMTTVRRSDFHCLISPISFPLPVWKKQSKRFKRRKNLVRWAKIALSFDQQEQTLPLVVSELPLPIWKKQSKRFNRKKNVVRWAKIALSLDQQEETDLPLVVSPHEEINGLLCEASLHFEDRASYVAVKMESTFNKRTKDFVVPLIQQTYHQENSDVSPASEVSLHTIDKLRHVSCVAPKRRNKNNKNIEEHLVRQMCYQKEHDLSSLADIPLHIEETPMKSASNVPQEGINNKTKDIAKLIKEMKRLKINKRVTTLITSGKKLVPAKVNLDPETIKEWELLMVNDLPSSSDKETEAKWKQERESFKSRIDLFINRMHILQGNRKFKQWKGSVVDSVVGVFLTQNVSDYLSSNAFMSVAAKFPTNARDDLEGLAYYIEEPQDVNDSIIDDQRPTSVENDVGKSNEFINLSTDSIAAEVKEHEKTAKRKNEKTGIIEDETVDWKALRRMYTKQGSRDKMYMDSVNWDDVRLSGQQVFETTIRKRGQFRILSRRILKFLNDEVEQNGMIDLEWLRDAPSDLVKRYLLEIEGIGLKSAECIRLLGLKHSAFPVDTNVGRIAVRLGWVPLEPLPNGVQMHQLYQYPSMDSIQKYLWPRLCKLPQETLYELHYQMITFGKVFCTKVIPNCNACPMKSECKYFASAYVSSKVLLEGPEEKSHEPDTFVHTNSQDVAVDMTSNINLIEEFASPGCSDQAICCEPFVEFPSSPSAEISEMIDIEDTPCRIPEIDFDLDALKKNLEDALTDAGKMLSSSDEEISKALVVLTPENACIPIKLPRKIKYYDRLRTEHVVYVLPDNHELLQDFERRELDDPSPYLLAIWQPGETSYSFTPPKKKCDSDGSNLCNIKTCSHCWAIREQSSDIFRGTILIPCRTATRAGFPLNGTYFQTNEVFADHETSLKPIVFPREWCEGLEKRALYCGSSVTSIFRFLDTRRIQLCFWTGFLCMRAFDRKHRNPKDLVRRLHTPPDARGAKFMQDDDI